MNKFALILAVAIATAAPAFAKAGDLSRQVAAEVLETVISGLDTYIDPATAKAAQARLRSRRATYLKLDTREAFAAAVSKDLFEVAHDKHLRVTVQVADADLRAPLSETQMEQANRDRGYGLAAVRRLPANIGYLKLSYFDGSEAGAAVVNNAMALLKDTDALIIDLRENTGGGGASDEALLGHLSREPIPMARITWRNADGSTSIWQREPARPARGPLYPDKPVYVLTSPKTFSAAEGLTYDLQAIKRAVIVGETTRGGANPSNRPIKVGYGFRVVIPNGRVEHPITKGNWEGVGVIPDVAAPVGEALTKAYALALADAKPSVATVKAEEEWARAKADPKAALIADQPL